MGGIFVFFIYGVIKIKIQKFNFKDFIEWSSTLFRLDQLFKFIQSGFFCKAVS